MNIARSWVSIVAIVAVAMLGVLALDRAHDQRHLIIDRTFTAACERHKAVVIQVNSHTGQIERNRRSLEAALRVASRERGQTTADRIAYARLQGLLDSSIITQPLTLPNCDKF